MAYQSWSVVFGEQPTAAKWNILGSNDAHFYSFLGDNEAWQNWVPTLTNLSGGTINYAKYIKIGKTVFYRFSYTLGGAGVSGDVKITLPLAVAATYSATGNSERIGEASLVDAGALGVVGTVVLTSTTEALIRPHRASGSSMLFSVVLSSTIPFTWGNTDRIEIAGCYEAA